jgi:hypothetical protein
MLKKEIPYLTWILGCAMLCAPALISAQDTPAPTKAQTEKPAEDKAKSRPPIEQYHLEFSINELEDGKKINSRQYSMDLDTNESNEIKIGTRIPVATKEGESREFQYVDVGTSIWARIGENRDQNQLTVRAESSNLATESSSGDRRDLGPVIRQLKMDGTVLLPVSKPVILSSADDPNSRRQFQLEVTATKIR